MYDRIGSIRSILQMRKLRLREGKWTDQREWRTGRGSAPWTFHLLAHSSQPLYISGSHMTNSGRWAAGRSDIWPLCAEAQKSCLQDLWAAPCWGPDHGDASWETVALETTWTHRCTSYEWEVELCCIQLLKFRGSLLLQPRPAYPDVYKREVICFYVIMCQTLC